MRKFFIVIGVGVTLLASSWLALSPHTVTAGQYWETSTSGTNTTGTGASVATWSNWSVPESPSNPCSGSSPYCVGGSEGFTNEAVWLINGSYSIETGFRSGLAVGVNGGWTTAMQPYYTTSNGATEVNATSAYNLPSATFIWMAALSNGSTSYVGVNNWNPSISYTVPGPNTSRQNYAQYETLYGDDWMGGGSAPSVMHMYYQSPPTWPSGWNDWGGMSCSPVDRSGTGQAFDYANACGNGTKPYQWYGYGYGNGVNGS